MFAPRHFAPRYFAPRFFPPGAEAEVEVRAGKPGRYKRYILPDGQIITDPTEAYAELERQLRVRAAELDAERAKLPATPRLRKRKRSRSIHPKPAPRLLATRPLPEIIERLPEAERASIDLELVALAREFAKRRDDEEALILLLT